MNFKYLSSDFLASYNEIIDDLEERQALLDTTFEEKVTKLVERERERLEQLAPVEFTEGQMVKIEGSNRIGKVLGSKIDFNVMICDETDQYGKPFYGPARFFEVKTASDEQIVTCEGMLRTYTVSVEANEIESDWGHSRITSEYYADELAKIEN